MRLAIFFLVFSIVFVSVCSAGILKIGTPQYICLKHCEGREVSSTYSSVLVMTGSRKMFVEYEFLEGRVSGVSIIRTEVLEDEIPSMMAAGKSQAIGILGGVDKVSVKESGSETLAISNSPMGRRIFITVIRRKGRVSFLFYDSIN